MDPLLRVTKNAPAISSCPVTSQSEGVCLQQSACNDPMPTASCSWIVLQVLTLYLFKLLSCQNIAFPFCVTIQMKMVYSTDTWSKDSKVARR